MRIKDWGHALLGLRRKPIEDVPARIDIREAVFARPSRRNARRFEGAIFNRLTEDFAATTVAIDQELRGDLTALRNRARMLRKNDPYFIKFAKMLRANVVGANQPFGFTFQSRVYDERANKEKKARPDTLANNAIEAGLAKWSRVCDRSKKHKSLRGLLSTAVDNLGTDGEILILEITGTDANNEFGYALQLLDVARIDTNFNLTRANGQNAVVMGVELDDYQAPVAYHLWEQPPGGVMGQGKRVRIPADRIIHAFVSEFAEQTRGIPFAYGAMKNAHQLKGYVEAAVIAARWGASKMGFYTRSLEAVTQAELSDGQDASGNLVASAKPGEMNELPAGYDFKSFDPTYPHDQFPEFVKAMVRGYGAALNVPYHSLGNDLEGVNFSSSRSGELEARDMWKMLQAEVIEQILFRITENVLRFGLLNQQFKMPNGSALPLAKFEKFANYAWNGRRWSWVDPLKDVTATLAAINGRITSPQIATQQQGLDLEDVLDDFKVANEMAANALLPAYGVDHAAPKPNAANAPSPAPAQNNTDDEDDE